MLIFVSSETNIVHLVYFVKKIPLSSPFCKGGKRGI